MPSQDNFIAQDCRGTLFWIGMIIICLNNYIGVEVKAHFVTSMANCALTSSLIEKHTLL